METQGKLLRVLETKRVKKVGDTAERDVDIRLISATNRDLSEMVREGTFREDLYYRLNVVPIYLPPLRERQGDIPLLAIAFLERFCKKNQVDVKGFTPEAMCLMESYAWPGNVRELRNIVERLAILCDQDRIEPHHLPDEIRQAAPRTTVSQLPRTWEEFKRLKQQVRDAAVAAAGTPLPARGLAALRGQRQPGRRGNRHPADESARLDAEVRANFGRVRFDFAKIGVAVMFVDGPVGPDEAASAGSSSISSTLLDQLRAGRPEAWQRLVRLYSPLIYRWCRRSGLAAEDAADVLQEVLAAVMRHVPDFRRDGPHDSFTAWLATITRNKVRDHYRRRTAGPRPAAAAPPSGRWPRSPSRRNRRRSRSGRTPNRRPGSRGACWR